MGDVIHTLPAVASLKQSFAQSSIAWAIEPKWATLLDGNPFIDEVIRVDRSSLQSMLHLRSVLRQRGFDVAIDFQGLIKSAIIASFARPDRIYGRHWTHAREPLASLFYSRTIRPDARHIIDQNLEVASAAGATNNLRLFPVPQGRPAGELPQGPFVLASPLAGWAGKQWPLENYVELARRLRQDCGIALVLNGAGTIEASGCSVHVSGLPGLIDATRKAIAVVGVDSGPLHLAAALGKPGVAIFGPTDPERNGPYGGSITVLRSPDAQTTYKRSSSPAESMRAITVDQVLAVLKSKLHCAAAFS
jgi:heptosyltransferase-1